MAMETNGRSETRSLLPGLPHYSLTDLFGVDASPHATQTYHQKESLLKTINACDL